MEDCQFQWIAETVLEPLVKEIEDVNEQLTKLGNSELHIGSKLLYSSFLIWLEDLTFLGTTSNFEKIISIYTRSGMIRLSGSTIYCITSQNGQPQMKNISTNAARFLKYVLPFWDVMHYSCGILQNKQYG